MKTSAFASILIAALALSGCSRNNSQMTENSYPIRLMAGGIVEPWGRTSQIEPLVVQVSKGSTAYFYQSPKVVFMENSNFDTSKQIQSSTLGHLQSQAALYKHKQDQLNKPAPVIIAGDDQAKCGAVFEAMANARRAAITVFYFLPYYMPTGCIYPQTVFWKSELEDPALKINPLEKPITITLFQDNTIAWENTRGTLGDYVDHLVEVGNAPRTGNFHFVIEIDARADFGTLRYMIDQIKRMRDSRREDAAIELRELK